MKINDSAYAGLSGLIEKVFLETARIVTTQKSSITLPPRLICYDHTTHVEGVPPVPLAGNGERQPEGFLTFPGMDDAPPVLFPVSQTVVLFTDDRGDLQHDDDEHRPSQP